MSANTNASYEVCKLLTNTIVLLSTDNSNFSANHLILICRFIHHTYKMAYINFTYIHSCSSGHSEMPKNKIFVPMSVAKLSYTLLMARVTTREHKICDHLISTGTSQISCVGRCRLGGSPSLLWPVLATRKYKSTHVTFVRYVGCGEEQDIDHSHYGLGRFVAGCLIDVSIFQ